MKRTILSITLMLSIGALFFFSCENSEEDTTSTPPVASFEADKTTITAGDSVQFTDESANNPTSWSWDFGDGNTSSEQNPSHTYSSTGTYTVELTVTNDSGEDTETKTDYITVESGSGGDDTEVVEVTNPETGKTWMDRNLGANRAATSSTDSEAYGDLYQWGRAADGHQLIDRENNEPISGTTSNLSDSDTPGHDDFIVAPDDPHDWRSPQNDNLWQGVSGTNNPCPDGYRLPTEAELDAERQSWSSNDAAGAFDSPLKLPVAGRRKHSSGSLGGVGPEGYYWSSTVDGLYSRYLYFFSSSTRMGSYSRASGYSVRCLKDDTSD